MDMEPFQRYGRRERFLAQWKVETIEERRDMRIIFLAGGIASGKSTAAKRLEELGAWRIDLDSLSRDVTQPGSDCLKELADEFGDDILDAEGALDRAELARRAFVDDETTAALERIELPYIKQGLVDKVTFICCAATMPEVCVVEIPLLDRMEDMFNLADEVVVVTPDITARRRRAMDRGMSISDFEARRAQQPDDAYLREHATWVVENNGSLEDLTSEIDRFWNERVAKAGA
jgi:dephospho-CoA kinase